MPTNCPHNQEWLKHYAASNRVQCMCCGYVWVSERQVKQALTRLAGNYETVSSVMPPQNAKQEN